MNLNLPDYLFSFNIFASALLLVSVLCLIWFGAARMPVSGGGRFTTAAILSVTLLGWFAAAEFLGRQNVYWSGNNPTVPTLQFGLLVPLVIGLFLLLRSQSIARLVDALPLSWLVGVQFYRALGLMFLILWWGGYLPWQFALPAGIGDIAAGLLALVVAGMLATRVNGAHSAAYAWCLFGIADLVVAVTMGTLTSPGRTHFVALDAPNELVSAYPLVMIPTFAVPVSIMLHTLCLWKLRRLRRDAPATQAAGA
jgi:hypothetical protein